MKGHGQDGYQDILRQALPLIIDASNKRPNSPEIRAVELHASAYAIDNLATRSDFANLSDWGTRVVGLLEVPSIASDPILVWKGLGLLAVVAMTYGREGKDDKLILWTSRMVTIAKQSPYFRTPEVALLIAKAAGELVLHLKAESAETLMPWTELLSSIADDPLFNQNAEIRQAQANGTGNAAYKIGFLGDLPQMEALSQRVRKIANLPSLRNLRVFKTMAAQTAVNAMYHYGNSTRVQDVKRWAKDLLPALDAKLHQTDEFFATTMAEAAIMMTNLYQKSSNEKTLLRWIGIAQQSTLAFPKSDAVRLKYLRAASNIHRYYGAAGNREQFCLWEEKTLKLADMPRWRDNPDVLRSASLIGLNSIYYHDEFDDFDSIAGWHSRLIDLADNGTIRTDSGIQFYIATALGNAVHSLGRAGLHGSAQTQTYRDRLKDIGLRFPTDGNIQNFLARYQAGATKQFFDGWVVNEIN